MKKDILVYPIYLKSRTDVVKIKPIMDVHYGAKTSDLKAFKEYIKDRDEHTYFFTNGDLWDSIYFKDKRFKPSGHDNTDEESPIDIEVNEMVKLLSPIKDRLICIGHGNHEETIVKNCHTNMSKRLADGLGVPFLGYSFWFRLLIRRGKEPEGDTVRSVDTSKVDFFCSHGFGGGTRTEGGSVTKYSKFADRFLCDVFVVGHDHRKQYVRYPLLGITGDKKVRLTSKTRIVCLGGSWKKSYSDSTAATWEESKGFPPSEIGGIAIEIKPKESGLKISVTM